MMTSVNIMNKVEKKKKKRILVSWTKVGDKRGSWTQLGQLWSTVSSTNFQLSVVKTFMILAYFIPNVTAFKYLSCYLLSL